MSSGTPDEGSAPSAENSKVAQRAAIRARLRAQIDSEARGIVAEDEVLALVHHGVHKHQREQRQRKVQLRKERLDNAFQPKEEKPHLVPKWLRDDRKVVQPQLAVESDECNLVCPVCNKFLFFPEPPKLSALDVEFLPCAHAIHTECKRRLHQSRAPEKLMCALCLKPMDRNDLMWTGKLSDSEDDDDDDGGGGGGGGHNYHPFTATTSTGR